MQYIQSWMVFLARLPTTACLHTFAHTIKNMDIVAFMSQFIFWLQIRQQREWKMETNLCLWRTLATFASLTLLLNVKLYVKLKWHVRFNNDFLILKCKWLFIIISTGSNGNWSRNCLHYFERALVKWISHTVVLPTGCSYFRLTMNTVQWHWYKIFNN